MCYNLEWIEQVLSRFRWTKSEKGVEKGDVWAALELLPPNESADRQSACMTAANKDVRWKKKKKSAPQEKYRTRFITMVSKQNMRELKIKKNWFFDFLKFTFKYI
jgi:hypothetical protein